MSPHPRFKIGRFEIYVKEENAYTIHSRLEIKRLSNLIKLFCFFFLVSCKCSKGLFRLYSRIGICIIRPSSLHIRWMSPRFRDKVAAIQVGKIPPKKSTSSMRMVVRIQLQITVPPTTRVIQTLVWRAF